MSGFDDWIQNSAMMQQIDKGVNKAFEYAGNLLDMFFKGIGSWLDDNLTPAIAAMGERMGQSMSNIQFGFDNMKSNLMALSPFGKAKGLEGPSIEKSITPGVEQEMAAKGPPQRNEMFESLLANNGVQKMNLNAVDMSTDHSLSGATAVFYGQQKSQSTGMGMG